MKPVTPRASAAPPGGADSAQSGIARMLPAAMVSKRFQQLFKGKGAIVSSPSPRAIDWQYNKVSYYGSSDNTAAVAHGTGNFRRRLRCAFCREPLSAMAFTAPSCGPCWAAQGVCGVVSGSYCRWLGVQGMQRRI